jgi:hypothetical protein
MIILKYKVVTTKKVHKCTGCHGVYPCGTKLTYQVIIFDGCFDANYLCKKCTDFLKNHSIDYGIDVDGFFGGELTQYQEWGKI